MFRQVLSALFILTVAASAEAATIYDESVSGDLLDAVPAGAPLTMSEGVNTISGGIVAGCNTFDNDLSGYWLCDGDTGDALDLTGPAGLELVDVSLAIEVGEQPSPLFGVYGLLQGAGAPPVTWNLFSTGVTVHSPVARLPADGNYSLYVFLNATFAPGDVALTWRADLTLARPPAPVPLPASGALLAVGLAALAARVRRRGA